MTGIRKRTIEFDVLYPEGYEWPNDLADIIEETDSGPIIRGSHRFAFDKAVTPDSLESELQAIGNDGGFFDDDEDSDDED